MTSISLNNWNNSSTKPTQLHELKTHSTAFALGAHHGLFHGESENSDQNRQKIMGQFASLSTESRKKPSYIHTHQKKY